MSASSIIRRLTGAFKNAVVWGATWFGLGFVTILALRTIGFVVPPSITALDAIGMSIRIGVMGGITGGAFSLFISQFYRGRRLSEINWVRFGIGGGIVAGLFVPSFMYLMNFLSGDGMPRFALIRDDIVIATLFGGIAAGASMWLAQRAETLPSASDAEPELLGEGNPLASMEVTDARQRERAGSRERR